MANLKKAATGAAAGAGVGSAFGPWGTLIGGVGGGLYGLLAGGDDGDSAVAAANADKMARLRQAQAELGAYRPQLVQNEMGAMNHRLGAYGGAQDALTTMYGKGAYQDPKATEAAKQEAWLDLSRNATRTYPEASPIVSRPPSAGIQQSSANPFAAPKAGNGPPLGNFPLADPMTIARRPK